MSAGLGSCSVSGGGEIIIAGCAVPLRSMALLHRSCRQLANLFFGKLIY